jgi:hypothetical protein
MPPQATGYLYSVNIGNQKSVWNNLEKLNVIMCHCSIFGLQASFKSKFFVTPKR